MPLLTNKRVLLAKTETLYGTDPIPTGAANSILVRNLSIDPQATQTASRDLVRPYLGNSESIPVAIHAACDFEIELAGSGAAGTPPAWGPLVRACGFTETVTPATDVVYSPVSDGFESVTIYFAVDGVLHKLFGARGSVSFAIKSGALPVMKYKFTGLYAPVVDAVSPSPTLTGWIKPVPVNNINTGAFTLHGYNSGILSDLSLDINVETVFRTLVGGAESVLITNRKPSGNLTIEAVSVAAKDWWSSIRDATTGALSIRHGTVAGNRVQIDAPAVQFVNPKYQDEQGIAMLQAGLVLVPGTSGNDEIAIKVF